MTTPPLPDQGDVAAAVARMGAARKVPCSRCGARPGEPCLTDRGYRAATHKARYAIVDKPKRGPDHLRRCTRCDQARIDHGRPEIETCQAFEYQCMCAEGFPDACPCRVVSDEDRHDG